VIIKSLFVILVLSAVALIGVAVAVFVRVRWHLKGRTVQHPGAEGLGSAEVAEETSSHHR
jgi:hypothetical protein